MSSRATLPSLSRIILVSYITLALTSLQFQTSDSQRLWDNYAYNHENSSLRTFHLTNLAVIGIAIGLSFLITLGFVLCRNHRAICGRRDASHQQDLIDNDQPPNYNFHDVILTFSGTGGQVIPVPPSTMFSPFYQQDLTPPPPYHLAVHYPPLQLPKSKSVEVNPENNSSETGSNSRSDSNTSVSSPVVNGVVNPAFDEKV